MKMEANSIVGKYNDCINRAEKSFLFGRAIFSNWTCIKIIFYGTVMSKSDFFKLLIESGFVFTDI